MTNKNIHKIILRNLLIGGIIISALTVFAVYLIELKRVDNHVTELAFEESRKYWKYYYHYYKNQTDHELSQLKQAVRRNLDHNLFVLIEFYNEKLKKILVESIPKIHGYKNELLNRFPDFAMTGKVGHKKTYLEGQLYIKVMIPVKSIDGKNKIIGHFEGIYHLSDDKMEKIRKQIFISLFQSIIVVLFTTFLLYPIFLSLNKKLIKRSHDLLEANINTLKSLGGAIAKRDSDTNAHNYRVTVFSIKLAEKIGLNKLQIRSLIKGAFLHDIGKIGISDTILLKPGKLTDDEFAIMKQHVVLGVEIIQNGKWLKDAVDVVLYHHEKFNGSGYMSGLKEKEIPVNARIFAIADVFDALTSKRPYKEPFSLDKSLELLREGSGSHFDPEFLKNFEQIVEELYKEISGLEDEKQLNGKLDLYVRRYFSI